MSTTVTVNGQLVRLPPNMVIGKGGEADVYKLPRGKALKLFKRPDDPDYAGQPAAQQGAHQRILAHQAKLPAFPSSLPPEVIAPVALAYDSANHIAGYTMPFMANMEALMSLGRRDYRETNNLDGNHVVTVFRTLAETVHRIHEAGVVIGDFSDLNILTAPDGRIALIDADSMQYGPYSCQTFTSRFVDPLRCAPDQLVLTRAHNTDSDWYAYFVMLLQSLLYTGPYGGVHRPATGPRLQHDKRVLGRITVLSPEVVYPKPAIPLTVLPDDLLHYMERVFTHDVRGRFPQPLLDNLRWTTCATCGTLHARARCPQCQQPGTPKPVMTIHGNVTARMIFRTNGHILQTVFQDNTLRYLYQEKKGVFRENGRQVMQTADARQRRLRIQGSTTIAADPTALAIYDREGNETERHAIDAYRDRLPMVDTNSNTTVWVQNGQLVSAGRYGPVYIGDILRNQTLVWAGEHFGLGFYQAGAITRTFVFRPGIRGINDQVDIGPVVGQITDATCAFANELAWLFLAVSYNGALKHRCFVVNRHGNVLASAEAEQGDDSWLGRSIRGHMAVGTSLFVATDDGIARIECADDTLTVTTTFAGTEPFVDSHTHLIPGRGGIHAVSSNTITLLQLT